MHCWLLIKTVTIDITVREYMKCIPVLYELQTDLGKEMQGLFQKEEENVFWRWMAR
jgi:hypothetical protein